SAKARCQEPGTRPSRVADASDSDGLADDVSIRGEAHFGVGDGFQIEQEAGFLGSGLGHLRVRSFASWVAERPASVVWYRCIGLRGFSGMVITTRPASSRGARTWSRNLVRFERPKGPISSGSVFSSLAISST